MRSRCSCHVLPHSAAAAVAHAPTPPRTRTSGCKCGGPMLDRRAADPVLLLSSISASLLCVCIFLCAYALYHGTPVGLSLMETNRVGVIGSSTMCATDRPSSTRASNPQCSLSARPRHPQGTRYAPTATQNHDSSRSGAGPLGEPGSLAAALQALGQLANHQYPVPVPPSN